MEKLSSRVRVRDSTTHLREDNTTEPYAGLADYYDLEHSDFRDDIDFYLNLIQSGPVLEIGAGTGRITHPLADAGFEVWGIDPSAAMLAKARDRLAAHPMAHLQQCSVLDLDLTLRFATAILPLNTLWHLNAQRDQVRALKIVRQHLVPDGVLLLDLTNPLSMVDRGSRGELRLRFTRSLDGAVITGLSSCWDEDDEQFLHLHLMYDRVGPDGQVSRSQTDLELRYLYRSELELMLRLTGFETIHVYGSYDLDPYIATSANIVAVATR